MDLVRTIFCSDFRKRCCLGVAFAVIFLVASGTSSPCWAAARDSFESPEPTWQLHERDCEVTVLQHHRTTAEARSGQSSEHLRLVCGRGTKLYTVLPMQPTLVIKELKPTLWIKSTRPGIRLMVRVVFPRTPDPRGEGRLTALVEGTVYQNVGRWQQLEVADILAQLKRKKGWELYNRFGSGVDFRESYVDMLVLNVYGGKGATDVWIDDLAINQQVTVENIGWQSEVPVHDSRPSSVARTSDPHRLQSPVEVRADRSLLQVDQQRVFVTAIQHHGEPLAWLRGLGVNTVLLNSPPSDELLAEAQEQQLWLIAPPPHDWEHLHGSSRYRQVIAWNLGERLSLAEINAARELAQSLRQVGGAGQLPLICSAREPEEGSTAFANISVLDLPSTMSGRQDMKRDSVGLGRRRGANRPSVLLASVSVESSRPEYEEEWTYEGRLRLRAYQALASGARGILFRSDSRLDAEGPRAEQSKVLQRVLADIKAFEPWGAGGTLVDVLETSDPQVKIAVLQTDRSRLLVALRSGRSSRHTNADRLVRGVSFEDLGATNTMMAYRFSRTGLRHLEHQRKGGSMRVSLGHVEPIAICVMTQDPLVIRHFNQHRLARLRPASTGR